MARRFSRVFDTVQEFNDAMDACEVLDLEMETVYRVGTWVDEQNRIIFNGPMDVVDWDSNHIYAEIDGKLDKIRPEENSQIRVEFHV